MGDAERELTAGDELEIPRRTPHQMWNPNAEPARVAWTTSPAGRTEPVVGGAVRALSLVDRLRGGGN